MQAAAGGGAVSVNAGAAAVLSNVTFLGNSVSDQGAGGLQIRSVSAVDLTAVLLTRNKVRILHCKEGRSTASS
jgi:hypothetical protein